MILQIVDNEINVTMKEEYVKAAKEFAEDSKANDQGCLDARVYENAGQENHIVIISTWDCEKNMEEAGAFLRHKADMKPAFCGNTTTILKEL